LIDTNVTLTTIPNGIQDTVNETSELMVPTGGNQHENTSGIDPLLMKSMSPDSELNEENMTHSNETSTT
jgi:hypothetical protein